MIISTSVFATQISTTRLPTKLKNDLLITVVFALVVAACDVAGWKLVFDVGLLDGVDFTENGLRI